MRTCGELAKYVESMSIDEKKELCKKIHVSGIAYLHSLVNYRPDAFLPKTLRERFANPDTWVDNE